MLINLACLSVLSQQPTKDPLTTHPDHARRHPGLSSTLPLSRAGVSALSLCGVGLTDTEAGVHDGGLLDDEAVGIELADVLARVGVADFGGLVGVEPDLAFAAVQDFRRELLLGAKIRHGWLARWSTRVMGWLGSLCVCVVTAGDSIPSVSSHNKP